MSTNEKRMGLLPALLVAVLSFGGFVGAASIMTDNSPNLVPVTSADEGSDDGDDNDDDKDDDEDKDKDDDGDSKSEKKAKEDAKKKAEREREAAKKAAERSGKTSDDDEDDDDMDDDDMQDGVKLRGDGSVDDDGKEDDDEDEDGDDDSVAGRGGDESGMYKDRVKTLSKLDKELAEAEKEILEKQAEGVDVTAALARLAEAKAKALTVGAAFDSSDLEAAKRLSKEVKKMAHFARNDDLHDAKEVAEDVAKVSKRITQAYGKITLLEAVGGDGGSFKTALAVYEADLTALKAVIAAGNYDLGAMEDSLEALERKVKRQKSSIEAAIYALGGTDSELDDDLEDESDDVAEHLNDVAEIEDDSVSRTIRGIADDHKNSTKKLSEKVKDVDKRNPVLQVLFGASDSDLNSIEQEIAAGKARTAALVQAAEVVEDQDVKSILLEQIETLKSQTSKLETFVSGQRDRLSLFGWFLNIGR